MQIDHQQQKQEEQHDHFDEQDISNFLEIEHELHNAQDYQHYKPVELKIPKNQLPVFKEEIIEESIQVNNSPQIVISKQPQQPKQPPKNQGPIKPPSIINPPNNDNRVEPLKIIENSAQSEIKVSVEGPVVPNLEQVMSGAYNERKSVNKNLMMVYIRRRNQHYHKHSTCYQQVYSSLCHKIKQSNDFMPYIIKFFHQQAQVYRNFYENSKKISAFKYLYQPGNEQKIEKLNWLPQLTKGAKLLVELKEETANKMKNMQHYLTNAVISGVEKHLYEYNKSLQSFMKNIKRARQRYLDQQEELVKKLKKLYKMYLDDPEKNKKDFLNEELEVFSEMKKSKTLLSEWTQMIIKWWQQIIKSQIELAEQLRRTIISYFEQYKQVHTLPIKYKTFYQYWIELDVEYQIKDKFAVHHILSISGLDFMKTTLSTVNHGRIKEYYTLEDFEDFGELYGENVMFGDRQQILAYLIVKKFPCQLIQKQKLVNILAVTTVDQNLVLYNETQCTFINRMQIKRLLNMRKSEYIVNVNEKIEGFIMDSWNKEVLHFKNSDQAEQFCFCTENNEKMKEDYVK